MAGLDDAGTLTVVIELPGGALRAVSLADWLRGEETAAVIRAWNDAIPAPESETWEEQRDRKRQKKRGR